MGYWKTLYDQIWVLKGKKSALGIVEGTYSAWLYTHPRLKETRNVERMTNNPGQGKKNCLAHKTVIARKYKSKTEKIQTISEGFKHKHKLKYKLPKLLCNPLFYFYDFDSMQVKLQILLTQQ